MQKSIGIFNNSYAFPGLSDKTWTCGLYHPKVARYQLRHTQICIVSLSDFYRFSLVTAKLFTKLLYYITKDSESQVFLQKISWLSGVYGYFSYLPLFIKFKGSGSARCFLSPWFV